MAFEDKYERAEYPITPGIMTVFNLNKGLNVLRGSVVIDAAVTIAGSGANGSPIGEGAAYNLIKRIRVIATKAAGSRYRGGALVNCHPQSLLRYAMVERSGKWVPELNGNGALGNGANGTYQIYLDIPIYFGTDRLINNVQTALNMNAVDSQGNRIYNTVQVQIDWAANAADLFYGNNGTLAFNGMVRWKDDRLGLQSDTIPLVQEDHDVLIQAPQEEFVDAAMPQDGNFESWLILARQGGPEWQLSDNILQRLYAQGASLNFKAHAQGIRQDMLNDGFYDPSSTLTGQFFIDWTKGVLANSNAAAGLQHHLALLNPSGAGLDQLRVYTRRAYGLA